MFSKPTVFILGAGASWHYNYPTGEDLISRMIRYAEKLNRFFTREYSKGVRSSPELPNFFLKEGYDSYEDIYQFLENFIERTSRVDPLVIDYFLKWNNDLAQFGKLLIAWIILDCEYEFQNKGNVNQQRILDNSPYSSSLSITRLGNFKDNWYRFIIYKLLSECGSVEDFYNNKISFVTFNYDISLETNLIQALLDIEFLSAHKSGVSNFILNRIDHVYGQVKYLDTEKREYIYYENFKDISEVKRTLDLSYEASETIRTIDGSEKINEEILCKAKDAIQNAEEVYILGYGFDKANNDRLNLGNALTQMGVNEMVQNAESAIVKKVCFTNFNDRNSVNKRISNVFFNSPEKFLKGSQLQTTGRLITTDKGSFYAKCYYEKSINNVYDALNNDFDLI